MHLPGICSLGLLSLHQPTNYIEYNIIKMLFLSWKPFWEEQKEQILKSGNPTPSLLLLGHLDTDSGLTDTIFMLP